MNPLRLSPTELSPNNAVGLPEARTNGGMSCVTFDTPPMHAVAPDAHELMHRTQPADRDLVLDVHMTRQQRAHSR